MLNAIEQKIQPYKYEPDHWEFLPKQIRDCINLHDHDEINGKFEQADKLQFFTKFEFIKGIKKQWHKDLIEDE